MVSNYLASWQNTSKDQTVLETVSRTESNIQTLKSHLHRREDLEILNWLTPIDYGPQHSDFLGRQQSGTGQWLLDSQEYQAWRDASKQTLFCQGIPGAGKTILTSIVINNLCQRFDSDINVGIAYVYCNYQRQGEQKVDHILASLLKQLTERLLSLPGTVKGLYKDHKSKRTRPSLEETSRVLKSVAAMYSRVFLIIDALDECSASDGCRRKLLQELFALQANCQAKLFATSRISPEIEESFKESLSLEIRAKEDDVRRYLDDHIDERYAFIGLQNEIKAEIVKAIDGMYVASKL